MSIPLITQLIFERRAVVYIQCEIYCFIFPFFYTYAYHIFKYKHEHVCILYMYQCSVMSDGLDRLLCCFFPSMFRFKSWQHMCFFLSRFRFKSWQRFCLFRSRLRFKWGICQQSKGSKFAHASEYDLTLLKATIAAGVVIFSWLLVGSTIINWLRLTVGWTN